MTGLSSEAIGCVVKLLSNDELIAVGAKLFNPLPGSQIGAKGYLGARIQPNSPTDNIDDSVDRSSASILKRGKAPTSPTATAWTW